jgi:hypothetical protein
MESYDHETDDVQPRRWWQGCIFRLVAVLCIVGILWISAVQPYLVGVTQPARQSSTLFRVALPGLDVGATAHPAEPGERGRVVFWLFFHNAEDVWFLPPLPGAPALPAPTPQPEQHQYASAPAQGARVEYRDEEHYATYLPPLAAGCSLCTERTSWAARP